MQSIALVLTLIAVLGMTGEALLRKYLLSRSPVLGKKMGFSEKEMLVAKCGIAAFVCFVWLLAFGDWWNGLAAEKSDARMWWTALAFTTLANILIQFANVRATRLGDVSFIAPISAMTPGLVLFTGLLIGEYPDVYGVVGIALIIIGTYVFVREGAPLREYFLPLFVWLVFLSDKHLPEAERTKRRALRWAYASAVCGTFGLMADGLVARHGDLVLAVALELSVLAAVYALFLPRFAKGEGDFAHFKTRFEKSGLLLIAYGTVLAVPFITLGVAFRLAPIAEVGSLKRLAIFFTVIGARWFLGEKVSMRRLLLASIIVTGAVFIALDPTPGAVLNSFDAYVGHIVGR